MARSAPSPFSARAVRKRASESSACSSSQASWKRAQSCVVTHRGNRRCFLRVGDEAHERKQREKGRVETHELFFGCRFFQGRCEQIADSFLVFGVFFVELFFRDRLVVCLGLFGFAGEHEGSGEVAF